MTRGGEGERACQHTPVAAASPPSMDTTTATTTAARPAVAPTRRKRKSTFVVRKEEKAHLKRELARLHAQYNALLHGTPLPATASPFACSSSDDAAAASSPSSSSSSSPCSSTSSSAKREAIALALRDRHLAFTGVRSLLSAYFSTQRGTATYDAIHLPYDATARRATLLRASMNKIRDARLLILERCRFLNLSRPHVATEWFEGDDGQMCMLQFDVTPFYGFPGCTVRDVYEAVGFYAQNVEIYASERLGDLTIREDEEDDAADHPIVGAGTNTNYHGTNINTNHGANNNAMPRVSQRRLTSATTHGITIDANVVMFRQYFPPGACAELPEEHSIMTTQSVESDALYPYVPGERLRHDLEGACSVRQVTTSSGARVTTLVRTTAIKRHAPSGAMGHVAVAASTMDEDLRASLRMLATQWNDLMLLAVRERLQAMAAVHRPL